MDFKKVIKIGQLEIWRRYAENLRKNPRLNYLFWESTLRCNLSCKHCGSACSPREKPREELGTSEIKKALLEIREDFPKENITLAITGGEPLVREDIFEVIEHASKLGFFCGMVTNGTLVTNSIARKLEEAGIKSISVSIDGLEKDHEFLRGKGNFAKAMKGVANIVNNQFQVSEIITCVYRSNLEQLEEIYKLVKGLGVSHWRLFTISPIGRAKTQQQLHLNRRQVRLLLDFIKDKRKKGNFKVSFIEQGFLGLDYEGEVRDDFFFCRAGINVGSILYDGAISACPSLPRDFIQGSIRRDRFKDVWLNEFKKFRNPEWKRQGICRECEQWGYCLGNGMHLWGFEKSEPSVCEYCLLNER